MTPKVHIITITDPSDNEMIYGPAFYFKADAELIKSYIIPDGIHYKNPGYAIFGMEYFDDSIDIEIANAKTDEEAIEIFKNAYYKYLQDSYCPFDENQILGLIWFMKNLDWANGLRMEIHIESINIY